MADLMTCYDTTLSDVLNKHAPLLIKTITVRPCVPCVLWLSDEINTAKQLRRKRERIFHLISRVICQSS